MNQNRRAFLQTAIATTGIAWAWGLRDTLRYAASSQFKYSVCNELFEDWDFGKACRFSRQIGYTGLEIAPFTLAESVDQIQSSRRKELRRIMRDEGLECVGLHWLLVTPKGLHITTNDPVTRARSWEYLKKLVGLCHDLGGKIMVLGSPKQRGTNGGATRAQATKYLTEGLSQIAHMAQQAKVLLLLEALPTEQTDVVTTIGEAVSVVRQVGQPSIQSMFDFHNTLDEKDPLDTLIRKYARYIRHVHVNELDGRHPGTGKLNYLTSFRALKEINYKGWISLEVFKTGYSTNTFVPERIATDTFHFLQVQEKQSAEKP